MPDIQTEPIPTPPAPRPGFVGVLRRGLAFLLDGVLLFLIGSTLERVARPALLGVNPWLPWISFLLTFLYFLLANGPLGNGQTVGKLVLHIWTRDREGRALSWSAALRRALVQAVALAIMLAITPEYATLIFPADLRFNLNLTLMLVMLVALSWLTALIVSVGIHPYKRGWHDLWADSFVTFNPIPETFAAALNSEPDPLTAGRLRKHKLITLCFWAIMTAALLIYPMKMISRPDLGNYRSEQHLINMKINLAPFVVTRFGYPPRFTQEERLTYVRGLRARQQREIDAAARGTNTPTTASLELKTTETLLAELSQSYDALGARAQLVRGPFDSNAVNKPEFLAEAEELRLLLWNNFQSFFPPPEEPKGDARYFRLDLYEPFQLFFNINPELRGIVRGPANPADGPLKYEPVAPRTELLNRRDDTVSSGTAAR